MAPAPQPDAAASFDPQRAKLARIAYRMLGSVADAEDVLQEAFLRWLAADRAAVREPEAYLRRIVTRLSLDLLKSAHRRRETYVGPWLPEPLVADVAGDVDDITLPLMLALERLSPLERAAFLLHDIFGAGYDEVAETIGRDVAACRQLATRARTHVRAARPRFEMSGKQGQEIAMAFFQASRHGDMGRLRSLLAADVVAHSDGGGRKPASERPIVGIEAVMTVHEALSSTFAATGSELRRYCFINGLPGFVTIEGGDTLQTTALKVEKGQISAIYIVRNPDKLRHLGAAEWLQ